MERLRVAGFEVDHDPAATRAAWAAVPRGAAAACGCELCAAWVAVRAEHLGAELLAALARLGLDPGRESELAHGARDERRRTARVRVGWAFRGAVRGGAPELAGLRVAEAPGRAPEGLLGGPLAAVELEVELPLPDPAP